MLKIVLTVLFFCGTSLSFIQPAFADSAELVAYKKKAAVLNDSLFKNGELPQGEHDELKRRIQGLNDTTYKQNQKVLIQTYDSLNKMDPAQRKRLIALSILMIKNGITPPLPGAP
jgi:hypothetical protein